MFSFQHKTLTSYKLSAAAKVVIVLFFCAPFEHYQDKNLLVWSHWRTNKFADCRDLKFFNTVAIPYAL